MKTSFFLFILFAGLLISCNKDDNSSGRASAKKNDAKWHASNVSCTWMDSACAPGKLSLLFDEFDSRGNLTAEYSFNKIQPEVSVQKLFPVNSINFCNDTITSNYHTWSDDVVIDNYQLVPKTDSYIRIETYDADARLITGRFSGTYVIDEPSPNSMTVDTIHFTDGKFTASISK